MANSMQIAELFGKIGFKIDTKPLLQFEKMLDRVQKRMQAFSKSVDRAFGVKATPKQMAASYKQAAGHAGHLYKTEMQRSRLAAVQAKSEAARRAAEVKTNALIAKMSANAAAADIKNKTLAAKLDTAAFNLQNAHHRAKAAATRASSADIIRQRQSVKLSRDQLGYAKAMHGLSSGGGFFAKVKQVGSNMVSSLMGGGSSGGGGGSGIGGMLASAGISRFFANKAAAKSRKEVEAKIALLQQAKAKVTGGLSPIKPPSQMSQLAARIGGMGGLGAGLTALAGPAIAATAAIAGLTAAIAGLRAFSDKAVDAGQRKEIGRASFASAAGTEGA